MKTKIVLLIITLFTGYVINAQRYGDITKYTQANINNGTARNTSLANSMSAVGGDLSSINTNPAGLSVFNHFIVSITSSTEFNGGDATYIGRTNSDYKTTLNFDNLGIIIPIYTDNRNSKWQNFNIGFSYNRTANFNKKVQMKAQNKDASMIDYFTQMASGTKPNKLNPFYEWLAYNTFLIDTIPNEDNIYGTINSTYNQLETHTIEESGGEYNYSFSFSGNYDNKFFVGATISLKILDYNMIRTQSETDIDGTIDNFKSFTFVENSDVHGEAADIKIGAIYKPTEDLSIGLALHSPSIWNIEENYSTNMNSSFDNGNKWESKSGINGVKYDLTTPLKVISSISYIFGSKGLINFEYENINYSKHKFSTRELSGDLNPENDDIKTYYKNTHNFRIGGEYRIGRLTLRSGYGLYMSPYSSSSINKNRKMQVIAGGLGFNFDTFYIDLAYSKYLYTEKYYVYKLTKDPIAPAEINRDNNKIQVTLGFRL